MKMIKMIMMACVVSSFAGFFSDFEHDAEDAAKKAASDFGISNNTVRRAENAALDGAVNSENGGNGNIAAGAAQGFENFVGGKVRKGLNQAENQVNQGMQRDEQNLNNKYANNDQYN